MQKSFSANEVNILLSAGALQSLIDIQVRKLKEEYRIEGDKIKDVISNTLK